MSQSLSKIYIHLVFSTKGRQNLILPAHREELFRYLGGVLSGQDCTPVKIGGTGDHIHILFLQSRNKTLSEIVRSIKSWTTKWIKEKYNINFGWQNGYGAFSVSKSQVERVSQYIINQEEHHRNKNFQDEFIGLLNAYQIEYDPQYLWD